MQKEWIMIVLLSGGLIVSSGSLRALTKMVESLFYVCLGIVIEEE